MSKPSVEDLEDMASWRDGTRTDVNNFGEPTKNIHVFHFPYIDDARDFLRDARRHGCVTNDNPDKPLIGGYTVEVLKSSLRIDDAG